MLPPSFLGRETTVLKVHGEKRVSVMIEDGQSRRIDVLAIGLFGLAVNSEFNYDKFFAMIPSGPDTKPAFTEGFFEVAAAQNPKPQTVALTGADAEFSILALEGARENAKKHGIKIVYDRTYPPNTIDFSQIVRSI